MSRGQMKEIQVCVVYPFFFGMSERTKCYWEKPSWFCDSVARDECNQRGCSKVQKRMVAKVRKLKVFGVV